MARKPKTAPEAPASEITVECIVPNVHLGDGRVLLDGETAPVSPALFEALNAKKQVRRV